MKKIIAIFVFFIGSHSFTAQTVVSSCSASYIVKALYIEDADRLALRKIYTKSLADTNSVIIPQSHADTILRALIAVYNATSLPARNVIVSHYNIHSFPIPDLKLLYVAADSTLPWMQQLKTGNIPTGNAQVDSLISTYYLTIKHYHNFYGLMSNHVVTFTSDSNYNIGPLTKLFENIPSVLYSEPVPTIGGGNDISAAIYPNYVELTYSLGWGDCPSGCTLRHYWKFNVYDDCSVEYVGEYGNSIPPTIFVSGSICANDTLTISISGANSYSLNNQPITTPQFTLSSPTAASYVILASNSTYSTSQAILIVDCNTSTFIKENNFGSIVSLYPNPVNEILNIKFPDNHLDTIGKIEIIDMFGKIILNEELRTKNATTRINVIALPKGIYYIKVGNTTSKFVKQ